MAEKVLDREEKAIRLGAVFSPATPIREKDVFMGRREQVRMVMDAINQRGQHVLIYDVLPTAHQLSLGSLFIPIIDEFDQNRLVSCQELGETTREAKGNGRGPKGKGRGKIQ